MNRIIMKNEKEFLETWQKEKGLIRQIDASKILKMSRSDIAYRIRTGKLQKFIIDGTPFLSFHEVCLMKAEEN